MSQPVVHFEITAQDYKAAQTFYSKLFDWEISEPPGMNYGLVKAAGEKSIGGGIGEPRKGDAPSLTFYVQVDDLQKYLDKAESLGGKTVVGETPIPGIGAFAMIADLDGNVIGLFKG
jgi:hypothetical protein